MSECHGQRKHGMFYQNNDAMKNLASKSRPWPVPFDASFAIIEAENYRLTEARPWTMTYLSRGKKS